jgi:hypothetical protein
VTFVSLVVRNLVTRRFRTTLTAFAVGIGVFSVVTLGVLYCGAGRTGRTRSTS